MANSLLASRVEAATSPIAAQPPAASFRNHDPRGTGLDHHDADVMCHDVVEFAGNPGAFFGCGSSNPERLFAAQHRVGCTQPSRQLSAARDDEPSDYGSTWNRVPLENSIVSPDRRCADSLHATGPDVGVHFDNAASLRARFAALTLEMLCGQKPPRLARSDELDRCSTASRADSRNLIADLMHAARSDG